jgi:hypothetical protein
MGGLPYILQWIGLSLAILIAAGGIVFLLVRWRIMRGVSIEMGRDAVLLAAGARVGAFGAGKTMHAPRSFFGLLMLLSTGLYFRSWRGGGEIFIPGPSISWIGVPDATGARGAAPRAIVIRFLNAAGKEDGIAIRLLSPEAWVEAIKTHLITRAV